MSSAWESLKVFLQEAVPENDPIPSVVIAIQSKPFAIFSDTIPCHILVTDGCFYGNAKSIISNGTTHFNFKLISMYL